MNLKIKKIALVCRQQPDKASADAKALQLAGRVKSWLNERGLKSCIARSNTSLSDVDLIVVLGGDGTYLQAVRWLKGRRAPILGVNLGGLGFLTPVTEGEVLTKLQLVLKGKMRRLARTLLSVQLKRNGRIIKKAEALNDVVIERGAISHLVSLSAYTGRQHISDFKADGVVIASPTGSTAYNLACGGPILYPYGGSFVVTPICPHALTNRPIIFPDSQSLLFKLQQKQKAGLVIDGQALAALNHGDEVLIKKSPHDHYVLREAGHNYFDVLKQKLNFGQRGNCNTEQP